MPHHPFPNRVTTQAKNAKHYAKNHCLACPYQKPSKHQWVSWVTRWDNFGLEVIYIISISQKKLSLINRMHVFNVWNTTSSFVSWAHNAQAALNHRSIVMVWVYMELTQTNCVWVRNDTLHMIDSRWLAALQINLTLRFRLMSTHFSKIAALNALDWPRIEVYNLLRDLLLVHHFVMWTCRRMLLPPKKSLIHHFLYGRFWILYHNASNCKERYHGSPQSATSCNASKCVNKCINNWKLPYRLGLDPD